MPHLAQLWCFLLSNFTSERNPYWQSAHWESFVFTTSFGENTNGRLLKPVTASRLGLVAAGKASVAGRGCRFLAWRSMWLADKSWLYITRELSCIVEALKPRLRAEPEMTML